MTNRLPSSLSEVMGKLDKLWSQGATDRSFFPQDDQTEPNQYEKQFSTITALLVKVNFEAPH